MESIIVNQITPHRSRLQAAREPRFEPDEPRGRRMFRAPIGKRDDVEATR